MADIQLDDSYSMDDLVSQFENFISPVFSVKINGQAIETEHQVESISIETTLEHMADSFEFTCVDEDEEDLTSQTWCAIGDEVVIQLGYSNSLVDVFAGIITAIRYEFSAAAGQQIIVSGMDKSMLMMNESSSGVWKEENPVEEIAGNYLSNLNVDTPDFLPEITLKNYQSDYHFLCYLAEQWNFHFFVVGDDLYFQKPKSSPKPVVTLSKQHVTNLSVEVNVTGQISEVEYKGRDIAQNEVIVSTASDIDKLGSNSSTGADYLDTIGTEKVQHYYKDQLTKDEGDFLAAAILNRIAMDLVNGTGECIGIPYLRAGKYIQFSDLGSKLNQPFLLHSVTHRCGVDGYITSFELKGNAF